MSTCALSGLGSGLRLSKLQEEVGQGAHLAQLHDGLADVWGERAVQAQRDGGLAQAKVAGRDG